MYTVRVEESFAAAHFLKNYHGKCERLHGHNYRVFVTISGMELDKGGMLFDFVILRDALKKVIGGLDHTSLNDHPEFQDGSPSAERIARFIFNRMSAELPEVKVSLVEVFETDKSRAAYSPD